MGKKKVGPHGFPIGCPCFYMVKQCGFDAGYNMAVGYVGFE